jgi:hypothetical protein
MFTRLTRAWRLRSAGILAVLYLACVLAPAAAFALGDGSRAAHCLTDTTAHAHHKKGADTGHSHDSGSPAEHSHDQSDNAPPADQQCCGLFCATSFPAGFIDVEPPALPVSATASIQEQGVTGNGPDTLYRPPIAHLSI